MIRSAWSEFDPLFFGWFDSLVLFGFCSFWGIWGNYGKTIFDLCEVRFCRGREMMGKCVKKWILRKKWDLAGLVGFEAFLEFLGSMS